MWLITMLFVTDDLREEKDKLLLLGGINGLLGEVKYATLVKAVVVS